MYRGEPVPDDVPAVEPNVLADTTPAALDWTKQLAAGSQLGKVGEGSIELVSDKASPVSWGSVKVPRPGLFEVVFRLGDLSPGTGLFLGDDTGMPLYVLGVQRDQRTGLHVLSFMPPTGGPFDTSVDLNIQAGFYAMPGQWVRLVAGSGMVKCWVSGDGRHWSRAIDALRGVRGAWSHVGLISFQTNDLHKITLEQLRVSELRDISARADDKLVQQVPVSVLTADPNPAAWQTRVDESLPVGTNPAAWRTACAHSHAGDFAPGYSGKCILNGVLEENLVRQAPVGERLRVLNQAAELYDAWEQPDSYRLSQFYERLGKQLLREGDREPWSKVGHALFTAPIWTNALFQTVPESLANAELLFRVYDDQWDDVRQLCRRLKFFNRPAFPEQGWPETRLRTRLLVEWAAANAERALGDKRRNGNGPAAAGLSWQHPLAVSLSKEGFNTLAELEATLGDQSYRDACQIILGVKPELALGLLPDGRDPRLMLSLPQAVDTAMRDYPGLRQTMVEQFGTLGRLRLQQALADASPPLLQALAVQFFGTSSAAAAHQWLGAGALADAAISRRPPPNSRLRLQQCRNRAERRPSQPRLRLASAMSWPRRRGEGDDAGRLSECATDGRELRAARRRDEDARRRRRRGAAGRHRGRSCGGRETGPL